MLELKQREIEQMIQHFIQKNFEYQNVLNSVLTLNRKLIQKRVEQTQKQKKTKILKYYQNQQKKLKQKSKAIKINSNSSLRSIKKPGFMEIIKNSFSFNDVSDYSDTSMIEEHQYVVSINHHNKTLTSSSNQQIDTKLLKGKEETIKDPLPRNDSNLLISKLSSAQSRLSQNESFKLKDLSNSKRQSIKSVEIHNEIINSNKRRNSIFKNPGNDKISDNSSKYSEDILNKAKRIQSNGTSEYINDNISQMSSFGNIRKINLNSKDIDSTKGKA